MVDITLSTGQTIRDISAGTPANLVELIVNNLSLDGDIGLEDLRTEAVKVVVEVTQGRRLAHLTPGKELTYLQKQAEVERFVAGLPAERLPYMRRRASRRRETLQQVKDEWEARINALRVIDLDIEDKYEAAREEIENAASVDDIKAALRGFLG